MKVRDSRRLTGPNIVTRGAGAVLDVALDPGDPAEEALELWRRWARRLLAAVGWNAVELAHRRFHGGLSLVMSAPIDALYAATEVNELAWELVVAELAGTTGPDVDAGIATLRATIDAERNPKLLALQRAAEERAVALLWDDDEVSLGLGKGSCTWPSGDLPAPDAVDWGALHSVPVALVTGTNGKTTTVRLLRAMARAAGLVAGLSSTDGCWVEGEEIGEGDYSGPGGARLVLRDRRVDLALLETARGGMLRRGLGVERAEVAVVTNVAEDHLGEWGIHDLDELAATKLVVAQGAEKLVINADDPRLRRHATASGRPLSWFGLDPRGLRGVSANNTVAAVFDGNQLVLLSGRGREVLAPVDEVPMTLGGAARHNIANALAAVAVAHHLGLPLEAVREGLRRFDGSEGSNPGRLNRFDLGGATALVDFAHNPHGFEALLDTARALDARRRCILVGQAGDRDDEAIRQLPRLVWQRLRPDRVVIKELPDHLRGRQPGEVPALIEDELRRGGAGDDVIDHAPNELTAVDRALAWARPGDLLLLLAHENREGVLERLVTLRDRGWKAGEPLT